jgi:hypothetical protein
MICGCDSYCDKCFPDQDVVLIPVEIKASPRAAAMGLAAAAHARYWTQLNRWWKDTHMPYIEDKLKKYLGGKTPAEAGLSDDDLAKLLAAYESGLDLATVHITAPICACNICRS